VNNYPKNHLDPFRTCWWSSENNMHVIMRLCKWIVLTRTFKLTWKVSSHRQITNLSHMKNIWNHYKKFKSPRIKLEYSKNQYIPSHMKDFNSQRNLECTKSHPSHILEKHSFIIFTILLKKKARSQTLNNYTCCTQIFSWKIELVNISDCFNQLIPIEHLWDNG